MACTTSANSIATIVSTRVLRPLTAVLWAAFFNFIAFLVFGLHVANTMGSGVIKADFIDELVVFGALTGAIVWNVLTWMLGIPSSSSHALVGGLVGAGIAKAGTGAVVWSGVATIGSAIVLSPTIGLVLAMLLVLATSWLAFRSTPFAVDSKFPRLADRLVVPAQPRPWRQRRAEDDGHHHRPALLARDSRGELSRPVLGGSRLPGGDGVRHAVRRLANRAHRGLPHHPPDAHAGILRRDGGCRGAVRCDMAWRPRIHDPHHHRLHRRRRLGPPGFGGALGCCAPYRRGLGRHPARGRHRRRCELLGGPADIRLTPGAVRFVLRTF